MTENTVLLSLAGYNQIKAENQKFRMFMERMWENSSLSADKATHYKRKIKRCVVNRYGDVIKVIATK